MTTEQAVLSQLPDLTHHTLTDLRHQRTTGALDTAAALILKQVQRPRTNLGGSGPPGRAD